MTDLKQTFSVKYLSSLDVYFYNFLFNLLLQYIEKSGSPGYKFGLPLKMGKVKTEGTKKVVA